MRYFISAAEESGEIYGARLVKEIKAIDADAEFEGVGGDRMKAAGVKILYHSKDLAAIGLIDILKKIFFFKKVLGDIGNRLKSARFDAVIVIDAPELNFRVGKMAHKAGIPVFYYVCPQLWAWRSYRVNSVKKWVDTMLVIFPFEEAFYRNRGVNVKFIGHPLLDEISLDFNRESVRNDLMPPNTRKLVGLLPGSRNSEIRSILVPLIETADIIHVKRPDIGFAVPVAPHISRHAILEVAGGREYIKIINGGSHKVMAGSDFLITKSGTSTLEAAIFGIPMIIVYRSSFLSYWLPRILANVNFAGLPNLIAGREIATEYLQGSFKPEAVAREALDILSNQIRLEEKGKEMNMVRKSLGSSGAAERAAEYIIKKLGEILIRKEEDGSDELENLGMIDKIDTSGKSGDIELID